jgi:hypothetical protein
MNVCIIFAIIILVDECLLFPKLAFNKISGTTPTVLQTRGFVDLDLSFNKLTGRFSYFSMTTKNTSQDLMLEVNRLSGRFPSIPDKSRLGELSALRGNLFGCGNVPVEDEYSDEYTCGSDSLDASLLVFLITMGALLVVACVVRIISHNRLFKRVVDAVKLDNNSVVQRNYLDLLTHRRMYSVYLDTFCAGSFLFRQRDCIDMKSATGKEATALREKMAVLSNIHTFSCELKQMTALFWTLMSVYLVSCIPLYTLKMLEHGLDHPRHTTHSYQYRWILTSAFLRGEVSLWLVVLVWVSVLSALCMLVVRDSPLRRWLWWSSVPSFNNSSIKKVDRVAEEEVDRKETTMTSEATLAEIAATDVSDIRGNLLSTKLKGFLAFSVNTCVVGCVDGLYIHFTSQSLPPSTVVSLQIGMALFNLIWNMTAVPVLSRPMGKAKRVVLIELGLLIMNNIILPCIVTALTSPECFQVSGVLLMLQQLDREIEKPCFFYF